MAKGFLQLVEAKYGEGGYLGDQHGGGAGQSGAGQPVGAPGEFMFATGIECSNPTIDHGKTRRDLLEECGHYARWREDIGLVKKLGLKVLRYGLPWHLTHPAQGVYDFEWADQAMAEIRRQGITPVLDLCHFGCPDWLGNFQNPELPLHFADYAAEVAKRYPWVRYYTPVNEIFVCARMSAKDGLWNEQLTDDTAFVTAIKHLVAASILATQQIANLRPDCIIVQSESAEYIHEARAEPSPEIKLKNNQRFISLDLLYAHAPDADICHWLMDNGLTREEYSWFMAGEPPGYQVMGNDYYGRNEHILKPDGTMCPADDVAGWYQITREYWQRYRKPVFHTETNHFDPEQAPAWLWKQWINVLRMRSDGVPVLGFTWYSLIDQIDWDTGLAKKKGTVVPCGLYDLDRKARPVAKEYKQLLAEFGRIGIVPHGEMFRITEAPARLKVEV